MINPQILKQLVELTQSSANLTLTEAEIAQLLTNYQVDSTPITTLVNFLLTALQKQVEENQQQSQALVNYQTQTHGIYQRLQRRTPRRLSLPEGELKEEKLVSPRTGSLATYYQRPSPRSRRFASLPNSPITNSFAFNAPELDNIFEVLTQEEIHTENHAAELSNLQQQIAGLSKQLTSAVRNIAQLEQENQRQIQQQTADQVQIKSLKTKNSQLQLELNQQTKEAQALASELKETNTDFYQLSEKNNQLMQLLTQEQQTTRQLNQQLVQKTDENYWLKVNFTQTKNDLLAKVGELTQYKKLSQAEQAEWQRLVREQEEKYEKEKIQREAKFNQQINNLRTFQLTGDIPLKLRSLPSSRTHSRQSSLYLPEPTKSPSLFLELSKSLGSSSLKNEEPNPVETPARTNSPALVQENNSAVAVTELLSLVDDWEAEDGQLNLCEENQQLRKNQVQLEKNWKVLFDEKVEQERLLQAFNQKELIWEAERTRYEQLLQKANQSELLQQKQQQDLAEEVVELKYQLAQSHHKTEERTNRAKQILNEKQADYQQLSQELVQEKSKQKNLTGVTEAVSSLSSTIKNLSYQFNIEISPK